MYKVMIVEDEPVIRNGIAKSISWGALGCEVAALEENGRLAFAKFQTLQPDIVVSDIMMPEMDGLELSDRILSFSGRTKIILLTGYKEFDYVKYALTLGVFSYILKPTDPEELEKTVEKAVSELNEANSIANNFKALHDSVETAKPLLRDEFFHELMFRAFVHSVDIQRRLEYFGIRLSRFAVLAVDIDSFAELENSFSEEDVTILIFLIHELSDDLIEQYGYHAVALTYGRCLYLILECEGISAEDSMAFAEELRKTIEQRAKFTVSIGVSNFYDNPADLRIARKEAQKCLAQRVFIGENHVTHIGSVERHASRLEQNLDIQDFLRSIESAGDILQKAETLSQALMNSNDENYVKNTVLQAVVLGVNAYCATYGEMADLFDPPVLPLNPIMQAKTLNAIASAFMDVAIIIDSVMQNKINKRHVQEINRVKEYIAQNYHLDLKLENVASVIFMSQWHFSKIFKKVTGSNFINYLTEVRIAKAKELIKQNPTLKNYEIANKVGFISERYFSELYKKSTGMTPSEFRGI
jgi:two-component system, response regulator YesN